MTINKPVIENSKEGVLGYIEKTPFKNIATHLRLQKEKDAPNEDGNCLSGSIILALIDKLNDFAKTLSPENTTITPLIAPLIEALENIPLTKKGKEGMKNNIKITAVTKSGNFYIKQSRIKLLEKFNSLLTSLELNQEITKNQQLLDLLGLARMLCLTMLDSLTLPVKPKDLQENILRELGIIDDGTDSKVLKEWKEDRETSLYIDKDVSFVYVHEQNVIIVGLVKVTFEFLITPHNEKTKQATEIKDFIKRLNALYERYNPSHVPEKKEISATTTPKTQSINKVVINAAEFNPNECKEKIIESSKKAIEINTKILKYKSFTLSKENKPTETTKGHVRGIKTTDLDNDSIVAAYLNYNYDQICGATDNVTHWLEENIKTYENDCKKLKEEQEKINGYLEEIRILNEQLEEQKRLIKSRQKYINQLKENAMSARYKKKEKITLNGKELNEEIQKLLSWDKQITKTLRNNSNAIIKISRFYKENENYINDINKKIEERNSDISKLQTEINKLKMDKGNIISLIKTGKYNITGLDVVLEILRSEIYHLKTGCFWWLCRANSVGYLSNLYHKIKEFKEVFKKAGEKNELRDEICPEQNKLIEIFKSTLVTITAERSLNFFCRIFDFIKRLFFGSWKKVQGDYGINEKYAGTWGYLGWRLGGIQSSYIAHEFVSKTLEDLCTTNPKNKLIEKRNCLFFKVDAGRLIKQAEDMEIKYTKR